MNAPEIWFPNLGVEIQQMDRVALSVFGIEIYWYAVIIVSGMVLAFMLAQQEAKATGQDPEMYWDFSIIAIIVSVLCARIYYVVFAWDMYKDNPMKIFAMREGGLAIYGGVIGGIITGYIFSKVKKVKLGVIADVAGPSLILGQTIGRWGNFINREAFGGYTESLFALRYKAEQVYNIPQSVFDKIIVHNGVEYIQVQPTFLYESLWNLGVFVFLILYKRKKKFEGEVFILYLLCYSVGRVWIEGLRTDQLMLGNTGVAVSQLLAGVLIVVSIVLLVYNRRKVKSI